MQVRSHANVAAHHVGIPISGNTAPTIPVLALGLASSMFLGISFILCVLSYLLLPSLPVAHGVLSLVLPGFQLLTVQSFFVGLVESIGWGWYVSLIFAPLFNFFSIRLSHVRV